jgi:hypothetical protein
MAVPSKSQPASHPARAGSVTTATRRCPRARRWLAAWRCASRLSSPMRGTSSPASPSTTTTGMPRALTASSDSRRWPLQPTRTAASSGAVISEAAVPLSVGSWSRRRRRPAPSGETASERPSIMRVFTGSRNAVPRCSSKTTPTMPERPRRREAARGSGPVYPRAEAASSTRRRVASETGVFPLNTTDAVEGETPASRATSAMVALRVLISNDATSAAMRASNRFDSAAREGLP